MKFVLPFKLEKSAPATVVSFDAENKVAGLVFDNGIRVDVVIDGVDDETTKLFTTNTNTKISIATDGQFAFIKSAKQVDSGTTSKKKSGSKHREAVSTSF